MKRKMLKAALPLLAILALDVYSWFGKTGTAHQKLALSAK
jgi:hypothetical protein